MVHMHASTQISKYQNQFRKIRVSDLSVGYDIDWYFAFFFINVAFQTGKTASRHGRRSVVPETRRGSSRTDGSFVSRTRARRDVPGTFAVLHRPPAPGKFYFIKQSHEYIKHMLYGLWFQI